MLLASIVAPKIFIDNPCGLKGLSAADIVSQTAVHSMETLEKLSPARDRRGHSARTARDCTDAEEAAMRCGEDHWRAAFAKGATKLPIMLDNGRFPRPRIADRRITSD